MSWGSHVVWQAPLPIYLGVAPMSMAIDSLTSIFLFLLGFISISTALFSADYFSDSRRHIGLRYYWFFLFLFLISMAAVVASANALTFLLFWEVMSISSAALIAADFTNSKNHRACLIYLGATRIATALLAGAFLWFHTLFGSWSFSDWNALNAHSLAPAILLLVGLCIKAGVWPFHIWLPYAHPAAPSPVSALMSGVMIKVAIYSIVRLLCFHQGSTTLGFLLLALGLVSSIWGILFALVQKDLKRLLAYSSIENIGLILIAIASCLLAQAANLHAIATLALSAALFHSLNHGLFKSLLFLCAGAVDFRVHTRELSMLGGLNRYMPLTAFWFLLAAASICALPPLNGFASKYLIYQGLFNLAIGESLLRAVVAVSGLGVLGLVGGLSLACFTKAVGVAFLGRARTAAASNAQEVPPLMVTSYVLLGAGCILLGLLAPHIVPMLSSVSPNESTAIPLPALDAIPMLAILFLILIALLYAAVLRGRRGVNVYQTWECGFGQLTPRMQTTSESFIQPELRIFHSLFQYKMESEISGRDKRHFPESIKTETEMVSLLETRLYTPLVLAVRAASGHLAKLQAGSIHLYLAYVLTTLIILLAVGVKL